MVRKSRPFVSLRTSPLTRCQDLGIQRVLLMPFTMNRVVLVEKDAICRDLRS